MWTNLEPYRSSRTAALLSVDLTDVSELCVRPHSVKSASIRSKLMFIRPFLPPDPLAASRTDHLQRCARDCSSLYSLRSIGTLSGRVCCRPSLDSGDASLRFELTKNCQNKEMHEEGRRNGENMP